MASKYKGPFLEVILGFTYLTLQVPGAMFWSVVVKVQHYITEVSENNT